MPKKKGKAREIEEVRRRYRRQLALLAVIAFMVVLAAAIYLTYFSGSGQTWKLDSAGLLAFGPRAPSDGTATPVESGANYTLEKVRYGSLGSDVYALLRIPKNVSRPPVVIVLPAASINKEADADMAKALCSWGYATLTLDERGNNGETAGTSPMDLNAGYQAFKNNGDPAQYVQVYDVLRGFDYLLTRGDLDTGSIGVLGESMGCRFAIIAAAEEPRLKAVDLVSAGPYGASGGGNANIEQFIHSIEPASYLPLQKPRPIAFFHFTDDPVIPISMGRQLYDAASQPKAWHEYNGTVHGLYSDIYADDLHRELSSAFGR